MITLAELDPYTDVWEKITLYALTNTSHTVYDKTRNYIRVPAGNQTTIFAMMIKDLTKKQYDYTKK